MKFTNDLGSDNIKGLVWTLAVPSMLSQLVSVLYSIVNVLKKHLRIRKY